MVVGVLGFFVYFVSFVVNAFAVYRVPPFFVSFVRAVLEPCEGRSFLVNPFAVVSLLAFRFSLFASGPPPISSF